MLKVVTIILVLVACCYCGDNEINEVLVEDARASKKRKNALRLVAMVLLFIFSKVAIFKVASFMFFYMIFQKFFALAGIMLTYFMKQKVEKPTPPTMYGPPGPPTTSEYNTIGYNYGPPDSVNSNAENIYPGPDYGLPSLTEIGGTFNNWLYNKNP